MDRTRAWRRYKNYTKAKRKRKIDISSNWWVEKTNDPFTFWINGYRCGWYDNLHQYSKNKIHCSCPMCSAKTRNKGKRRHNKFYAPSINYGMMDKRRQMAMDYDIKNFENEIQIKGVKQMYNNYRYIETPNKVIALSTYAGKTVRGIAKCHPNDTFDVEFGRKLAAARCNIKVAEKRVANAKNKYWETYNKFIEATKAHDKYSAYYMDAAERLREAEAYLDEVRSSIYDA